MIIQIPYEWLEKIFGSFVAQNFSKIAFAVLIGGFIISRIIRKKRDDNWFKRAQRKSQTRFEYMNRNVIEASQARRAKELRDKYHKGEDKIINNHGCSPTGWIWNEEKQLWDPPDYLSKQSKEKWEWDEKRRIWIDREKKNKGR